MLRTTVRIVLTMLLLCGAGRLIRGQAAGAPPSFDVISVRPSTPDGPQKAIFPLGPGDVYVRTGGLFSAQGFSLANYLYFAFKVLGNDSTAVAAQLPDWALNDRFDIQARTDGDPAKDAKDQMRLMMRSLLAERFRLKSHYETRQVPIFAVSLARAGKMGPQLQQHPADAVCNTVLSPTAGPAVSLADTAGIYPQQCGGMLGMPSSVPGRLKVGARNVTMAFIANQLTSLGALGRPAVDQTGLPGTFDFVLEFVPDTNSGLPLGGDFQPDPNGPTFSQAVRDQLGLKLESSKGPSEFLIIDHVEKPSEN